MSCSARTSRRNVIVAGTLAASGLVMPKFTAAQRDPDITEALAAAEELSVLEATEHLPALYTFYDRMHPDAQAIIPRHVVIGWYRDNWQPMGPQPAVATAGAVKEWTWPVNGVTYTDTYEVFFTQEFDNAPTREDVVRLVYVEPHFRWFFGRNEEFVNEQIAYYNDLAYIPQGGSVPFDLQRVIGADPGIITSLPSQIDGSVMQPVTDAVLLPEYAESMPTGVQYKDAEFPVGYARATRLRSGFGVADTIDKIVDDAVETPPFRLISWNLEPANEVPFARFEHLGSEAIGNVQTIFWGAEGGNTLWEISFFDVDSLATLAAALVDLA